MEVEKEVYVVTVEQIKKVNTYIPIKAKTEFVNLVVENCIDKLQVSAMVNNEEMSIPPFYKENSDRKSRYLMGAFVKLYLLGNFDGENDDEFLMPADEYDKWAGGHIINQIERMKHNPEVKDICFDMIQDFKDLEKRLNVECFSYLAVMNDGVARQFAAMQANMSPESFEEVMKQMDELKRNTENLNE